MAMKWVAQMPVPATKPASAVHAQGRRSARRACSKIEKAVKAASRQIVPATSTSRKSCSPVIQA